MALPLLHALCERQRLATEDRQRPPSTRRPKITSRSACSMTIDFMAIHADRHSGADDSLGRRVLAVAAATEDGVADMRRPRTPRGGTCGLDTLVKMAALC